MLISLTLKDTDHSKSGNKQRINFPGGLWLFTSHKMLPALGFTCSVRVDPKQCNLLRSNYKPAPALFPSWVLIKLLLWAGIMLSSKGDIKEACGMVWSWSNLQCGGGWGWGRYIHNLERFKRKKKHQGNLDASIGFIKVHFRGEKSYRKGISELSTDAAQPGERKGKSYWRTHSCLSLD